MKALKLKLVPEKGDYALLHEMFGKWASLCTRMARAPDVKEARIRLAPRKKDGLEFSKTQLCHATVDIKDHRDATRQQLQGKQRQQSRIKNRLDDIKNAIGNDCARSYDPNHSSRFYIKDWVKPGQLPFRFKTLNAWNRDARILTKQLDRATKTITKMEAGKIIFKPTRIT